MSEYKYGFEIDFLPVGNGEKSGDAIAIRYGYPGQYKVMVFDGGTKESGQALVDHIKKYYNTEYVDYVVNSHPDGDHASGLSVVLEQMKVGELWIHRPWEHSSEIRDLFKDGRITDTSLTVGLKDALNAAYTLETIAVEKCIPIYEPFQGSMIGDFVVLSPSEEWYLELVPHFKKTPDAKVQEQANVFDIVTKFAKSVIEYILESWHIETLSEDGNLSADNQSGVVLYANLDNTGVLLTGDAGIDALSRAADYAEELEIDLSSCNFIQVPHHGSRNNVSPSVLNRIVGNIVKEGTKPTKSAYVSASKESTTHPRKVVLNAFTRRGAKVIATQGSGKYYFHNFTMREGWTSVEPLPFYKEVEK